MSDRPEERIEGPQARRYATVQDDLVGAGPVELLDAAEEAMTDYSNQVEVLLRHVPRKFGERIMRLSKPRARAREALGAARVKVELAQDSMAERPEE